MEVVKNMISKKKPRNIVTFATIVNAIDLVYGDLQSNEQVLQLGDYLSEFFNKILNAIPELTNFEKRQESKVNSLIAENFMFYRYIAISKILREKENWKELVPVMKQLDLEKGSKLWHGKVIKGGKRLRYYKQQRL